MFGFILGSACVVGLVKTLRGGCGYRGYQRAGCGGGAEGGWQRGGHGRWGGGGFGGRWMLRGLFERLETTPGQEKVILQAIEDVQAAAAKARGELEKSRQDIATALKGEQFDHEPMKQMFTRQDTELEDVRKTLLVALEKVHEALTPAQRTQLSELVQRGFGGGHGHHGHHGGWHHRRWNRGGGWDGAQSV